jgi:hypothetical protein
MIRGGNEYNYFRECALHATKYNNNVSKPKKFNLVEFGNPICYNSYF